MNNEKIFKELMKRNPVTYFFVDHVRGDVYMRNEGFEAGIGTLYEHIAKLDPAVIAKHANKMNPEMIKFIDDSNRKEKLEEILVGWSGQSAILF